MSQCQECYHWERVTRDKRRKGFCMFGDYCGPTREACGAFKPKEMT